MAKAYSCETVASATISSGTRTVLAWEAKAGGTDVVRDIDVHNIDMHDINLHIIGARMGCR